MRRTKTHPSHAYYQDTTCSRFLCNPLVEYVGRVTSIAKMALYLCIPTSPFIIALVSQFVVSSTYNPMRSCAAVQIYALHFNIMSSLLQVKMASY